MEKGRILYRAIVGGVRQIAIGGKRNLEVCFKLLQKQVEKQTEVTNEDGTKATKVEKVWEDCNLPAFKADGTAITTKRITLSNNGFCLLPITSDTNVSDEVKEKFLALCAETENAPLKVYDNVSAFARYLLEGRYIAFSRDLYHMGEVIETSSGGIEAKTELYTTNVIAISGKMAKFAESLLLKWIGKEIVEESDTPTTTATTADNNNLFAGI